MDLWERLSHVALFLPEVACGRRVTQLSDGSFKERVFHLALRVAAIAIFVLAYRFTIPLAIGGLILAQLSSSLKKVRAEYSRVNNAPPVLPSPKAISPTTSSRPPTEPASPSTGGVVAPAVLPAPVVVSSTAPSGAASRSSEPPDFSSGDVSALVGDLNYWSHSRLNFGLMQMRMLDNPDKSSASVAGQMENRGKNRYPDNKPYDFNRVDTRAGNYLNCSEVKFQGVTRYLAQCPTEDTLPEFLTVVRERNLAILCLLNDADIPRKGYAYWTEAEKVSETTLFSCETESVIEMTLKFEDDLKPITLVRYKGWVDHSTPNMQLFSSLREHMAKHDGHWLVHCSAGIGRAGTLMTIDAICSLIEGQAPKPPREVAFSFPGVVIALRRQRMGLVTSEEQLKFIVAYLNYKYPA